MRHETIQVAAADGTALHVELWRPEGPPKLAVLISHGSGEYVARHGWLAEELVPHGALVFGPDHRGEGHSGGPRGHVEDFSVYGADLARVAGQVLAQVSDGCPLFVFGHSMGGLVALVALLDGALPPARGVVLSAPLLGLTMPVPAYKRVLGHIAARLAPTFSQPSGIPADAISHDPEVVAAYEADTVRSRVVSAGWFAAMQRAIARVEGGIGGVDVPLLWYVGDADPICDPAASRRAFARLADPDAHDQTFRELPGYFHELHNEPPDMRAPVHELVRAWIMARATSPAPGT